MSSSESGNGFLLVEPGSSWALIVALVLAHALALAAAIGSPLGVSERLLLGALILIGLLDALWAHGLHRGRAAVRSARWLGDGDWVLVLGNGEICEAHLAPGCLVLPRLVVVRFALGRWRRRTLIVPADSLSADTHRRLRSLLLRADAATRDQRAGGE